MHLNDHTIRNNALNKQIANLGWFRSALLAWDFCGSQSCIVVQSNAISSVDAP
jgi:hypothetical protein